MRPNGSAAVGTVLFGFSMRPWANRAMRFKKARTLRVNTIAEGSRVRNARNGTAESTEPRTISVFAASTPSAKKVRAQQKKLQVVPMPMQVPAAMSMGDDSSTINPLSRIEARASSTVAAVSGLRLKRQGSLYAPTTKTRNDSAFPYERGALHSEKESGPSVVCGSSVKPQRENEFMARKQAKPALASSVFA